MKTWLLYLIVSISGAVILSLEILGTRILGPFYGVSLYLWSALISVTLMSLSLGYWAGGRLADRSPNPAKLAIFLVLSGLWIALTPLLKLPLLKLTDILGLRGAVLVSALLLFSPPLTLLGMISPFAIKLQTHDIGQVGRTAGTLSAVSTFAGVVAALLTGFLLIPYFGVIRLSLLLGGLLLFAALLIVLVYPPKNKWLPMITLLLGAVMAVGVLQVEARQSAPYLASGDSPYADVRVAAEDGNLTMLIDGAIHTMVDSLNGANLLNYGVVLELINDLTGLDNSMLMIGLGGGALFNKYVDDGWQVDAVEIDPLVIDYAYRYFNLADSKRIFCEDGRQFLMRSTEKYAVILIDAFGSSSIPFQLTTREAFSLIKSHTKEDGLLAINVISEGWNSKFLSALASTIQEHYRHVLALPCHEPPNTLGNIILLASDKEITMPEEWLPRPFDFLYDSYLHWAVVQKNHAWDNRFEPTTANARVLTDDLNPVDLWAEEINLASRLAYREEQETHSLR
ncbi:MAG: hypothetical protein EHM72_12635 [Calditrichaeota bacterium]|nr:MAG: hypothetical protein EHM72_12635 [Calditrichota bacterium]